MFFTALPIVYFALFDIEHQRIEFLINPKLYKDGPKGTYFNFILFWRWIVLGIMQSLLVYYMGFLCFNWAPSSDGRLGDVWLTGTFVYLAVVILSNTRILYDSNSHTWYSILIIFLSIGSFYVFFYLENLWKPCELFGLFPEMHKMPVYYLATIFMVLITFPIDMFLLFVDNRIREDRKSALKKQKREERIKFQKQLDPSKLAPLKRCKLNLA